VDYAMEMIGRVNAFLMQAIDEKVGFAESRKDMFALYWHKGWSGMFSI